METRLAAEDEDTRDEVYPGLWERLKGKSQEIVGQARERREEVERLFRELMQAEPSEQFEDGQLASVSEPRPS